MKDGSDYTTSDEDDENSEAVALAVQDPSEQHPCTTIRCTMRFKGSIGLQDISILLDSGSVGTFYQL